MSRPEAKQLPRSRGEQPTGGHVGSSGSFGKDVDATALVLNAVRDTDVLRGLDPATWERVLSCARRNAVLAYLAYRAESAGLLPALPEKARLALASARMGGRRLAQLARWELDQVARTLSAAGVPMIALKGVAYLLREMPHASTRLMTDIDVMVPHASIDTAESSLRAAGWRDTKLDAYDQSYYRRWSHEIPPMRFPGRLLGVDVHHTIIAPVSRLRPDPNAFWSDALPTRMPGVRVLSPVDSVLHAAVHLFFDSDFDGRFRDVVDLHEMVGAFGEDAQFWPALVSRAAELGLGRPLFYAVHMLDDILGTPLPPGMRDELARFAPPAPARAWMMRTLREVLTPIDPQPWPPLHRGKLWLLYVRSHWLRMPPHVLIPHLLRKSLRRGGVPAAEAP
jgi:hypothetical protein